MSWLKGLMGGAAGAAGYATVSQYETKDLAQGLLGIIASRDSKGVVQSVSTDPQVQELTKQVQDLQKWLQVTAQQQRQPVTIVTSHNARGGWTIYVIPTSIVGAYLLYLRYWKGYKLTDFMYVTQRSLSSLKSSVSDGLARVQEDMTRRTTHLAQQLGLVVGKQDTLMSQQQHMDNKMTQMGDDVEGVKANVSQMHGDVRTLQANVDVVQRQLEWGNQGIYVLCHAISDMAKAVDFKGKSRGTIDTFLQHAPLNLPSGSSSASTSTALPAAPSRPAAMGLEGLLDGPPSDPFAPSSSALLPAPSSATVIEAADNPPAPVSRGLTSYFTSSSIIPGIRSSRAASMNSRTTSTPL